MPISQFEEHNALQQSSKELADLERKFRAPARKDPDKRSQWFNSQQSINKIQTWEFRISTFQYVPDPKLERFGDLLEKTIEYIQSF